MRNRRIEIAEFFAVSGCRTMPRPGALSGAFATAWPKGLAIEKTSQGHRQAQTAER